MSIAIALLAGATAFFAGFCLGNEFPRRPRREKPRVFSIENEEYKNFLSYDGSVQV